MLFDFTGQAQGIPVEELPNESPFYSNLAWDTYLIDEDTLGSSSYITQPRYEEYFSGVDQRNVVDENGSMGEMYFNSAIAIQQKIFIGVTLGFVAGTYSKKTSFTEQTTNDSLLLDYHVFVYEQESDINGINLKLGVIYKPQDWLRLGLAYHLPYKIHIVDNWFTTLRSQFKDGDFYSEKSPDGRIDYEIKNPGKLIFSAALISGFRGLLSMDAEWIDYSKSKIISDEFDFGNENQVISEALINALTIRLGGEIWFGSFNFRAGYAYRQNAYKSMTIELPEHFNTFSIGAGVLTKNQFYINMSISYKDSYRLQTGYNPQLAPLESVDESNVEILVSTGYRF